MYKKEICLNPLKIYTDTWGTWRQTWTERWQWKKSRQQKPNLPADTVRWGEREKDKRKEKAMEDKIKCLLLSILYVDFRKHLGSVTCTAIEELFSCFWDVPLSETIEQILFLKVFIIQHAERVTAMEAAGSCLPRVTPRWMTPTQVKLNETVTFNH